MIQKDSFHYTVYLDRLFIEYLLVYSLLMLLFGILMKRKIVWKRLLVCAAVWSMTGIGCLFFPASFRKAGSMLVESAVGMITFYLLYGKVHKKAAAGMALTFGISVMYLSGCFQTAYRLERFLGIRGGRLLIAALLFSLLILWGFRYREKTLWQVRFIYQGKEYSVRALLDTGNALKEPVSKKPVCVMEQEVIDWEQYWKVQGIYMIPYHSVGKDAGLLPAIKLYQVEIANSHSSFICQEMLVALYQGRFSDRGKYQMLLHPDYLKERNEIC